MKKIIYIAIVFIFALTSCTNEEKDIFGDSAANRMTAALKEYKEILVNAPNGWIMEYYAGKDTDPAGKIGGFVFLMSFEDDLTVTIASEVLGSQPPKTQRKSYFDLIGDQGPVLTFNTYNEIFHVFSEPSQSDLDGYGGDYEFIVMSATEQQIVLKGRRGKHTIVMTPVAENATWDGYIDAVTDQRNKITYPRYTVTANNTSLNYEVIINPTTNYLEVAGERFSWGDNFTYTPTGINLYKPVRLGEYEIKTLTWDETKKQFTTVVDGVTIVLEGFYPENYSFYDDYIGDYSVQYRNISNQIVSKRCSIIALDRNKGTYLIRGLHSRDWTASYDVLSGGLSILAQNLGAPQSGSEYFLLNLLSQGGGIAVSDQYRYEGTFDAEGLIIFKPNPADPSFYGMAVLFIADFEDGTRGYAFESENDIFQNLMLKKR